MDISKLIIKGKRVELKVVNESFKDEIFKEFNESIITYMYPCVNDDISQVEGFIKRSQLKAEEGIDFTFMIIDKDTGEYLGNGGVHHLDQETPELGIWIKKSAHGNHYGYEAVEIAFNYFKNQYQSFLYPVDKRNIPSKKIALGLGGKLSRTYDVTTDDNRLLYIEEYIINV